MKFKNFVAGFLFLGFFFNLFNLFNRFSSEKNYNFVEFSLNYTEIKDFSRLEGINFIDALSNIRELDIPLTSILFDPITIYDMQSYGKVTLFSGNDILKMLTVEGIVNPLSLELDKTKDISPVYYYIFTKDLILFKKIKKALLYYYDSEFINDRSNMFKSISHNKNNGYLLEIKKGSDDFCHLPITLPIKDMRLAQKMGFLSDLRIRLGTIFFRNKLILNELKSNQGSISSVILKPTKKINSDFSQLNFLYNKNYKIGIEEFDFKYFPNNFLYKYKKRLIRSHDAGQSMFKEYSQYLLYRYFRAAEERNIRYLVFHLNKNAPSIEKLGFFLKLLKEKLSNGLLNLSIRENKPLIFSLNVPDSAKIFLESAVILTVFLIMINPLIQLPISGSIIIVVFSSIIFGAGSFFVERFYFDKVLAQFASFFFPVFGYFYWREIYSFKQESLKKDIKSITKYFMLFTGVNFYGVLCLTGLLNSSSFFLKVIQFRSIKLALIAPILLLSIFLILQFGSKKKVYDFFVTPINIAYFIVGILSFSILALFLIRSGNISRAYIPGFEDHLRNLLDRVLIVRPRFKEFIWGYPLFFAAFNFKGFPRFFLLVLSSVGQISLFNTFCHFHTPIIISLLRTFNGILLGVSIGILLNIFLRYFIRFIKGIIENQ